MTAAIVVLSIALATAVGGLIAQQVQYRRLHGELTQAGLALLQEARRGDELQADRDAAVVREKTTEARAAEYARRLNAAETQRNEAIAQEGTRAQEAVSTAGAAGALDLVNGLLQGAPVPAVRQGHPAPAGGAGDGGTPAVQPAAAPGAPAAGRRP